MAMSRDSKDLKPSVRGKGSLTVHHNISSSSLGEFCK